MELGAMASPSPTDGGIPVAVVRRILTLSALGVLVALVPTTMAGAQQQNPTTGQPGTTAFFNCGLVTTAPDGTLNNAVTEPGRSANAPGSAFNENGGTAGSVYAGNGTGSSHSNSTAAVSQYDSACRQLSNPPGS
jgi:hypothetical protein